MLFEAHSTFITYKESDETQINIYVPKVSMIFREQYLD